MIRRAGIGKAAWIVTACTVLLVTAVAGPGRAAAPDSAVTAAAPDSSAAAPAQAREVPVTAAFVIRGGEPHPLDAEPPHPGEVVGLRLDWPEGERVPVELVAPGAPGDQIVPLNIVPEDPRAGGADVIEVLLLGLDEVEVPPILMRAIEGGLTYTTAALTIDVKPTLAAGDTALAPSRGQAEIGWSPLGIAVWVAVLLLVIALVVWLIRRRRRATEPPPVLVPEIPPDVWAHKALDRLLSSGLLESGRIKAFHVELAAISKEYLSHRFRLHLMERTTEEVPRDLRAAGVAATMCDEVGTWLAQIDLVKFAGETRGTREVDDSVAALRAMIEATRPSSSPVEPAPSTELAPQGGTS